MENHPIVPSVENRLLLLPGTFVQGAAILVSRMAGLRSPDAFTLMERKADSAPWVANVYQDAEGQVWNEVDVAALAQHENFLNVGR
jgi:twitching motility protein PilI